MDTMNEYRTLVQRLLYDEVELAKRATNDDKDDHVAAYLIVDEEHDQYMAVRHGWSGKQRVHSPIAYIPLQNGKIWIEEDWTEDGIANRLVSTGVPKSAIVLGFRHPSARPFTEYAVA